MDEVVDEMVDGGASSGSRERREEMLRRRGWFSSAGLDVGWLMRDASLRYEGGSAER